MATRAPSGPHGRCLLGAGGVRYMAVARDGERPLDPLAWLGAYGRAASTIPPAIVVAIAFAVS